jgi:hypothetical protein
VRWGHCDGGDWVGVIKDGARRGKDNQVGVLQRVFEGFYRTRLGLSRSKMGVEEE